MDRPSRTLPLLFAVLMQLVVQPVAAASPCVLGAWFGGADCCCGPEAEAPAALLEDEGCCAEEAAADEPAESCGCKLAPSRLPAPSPATAEGGESPSVGDELARLPAFLSRASYRSVRTSAERGSVGEDWIPPRILWCVYRL